MTKEDICKAIDDEAEHATDANPVALAQPASAAAADCPARMETYRDGTFLCTRKVHADAVHVAADDDGGVLMVWTETR